MGGLYFVSFCVIVMLAFYADFIYPLHMLLKDVYHSMYLRFAFNPFVVIQV